MKNIIVNDIWGNENENFKVISLAKHYETDEDIIVCCELPTTENSINVAIHIDILLKKYRLKHCGNILFCDKDCSSCNRLEKQKEELNI